MQEQYRCQASPANTGSGEVCLQDSALGGFDGDLFSQRRCLGTA